ncbi:MAG: YbfB/YjiJ family MFS transporter [Chloroflexaceae bacterium]
MRHARPPSAWLVALGGMFGLVIAMGVGRFAYTPLLPIMQQEYGFGPTVAGGLAAVNYGGYLLGALLCMAVPLGSWRMPLFRGSLLLSVITTAAMGLFDLPAAWWPLRFLAGLASAGVMVVGVAIALDSLAQRGAGKFSGLVFAGVGAGIALSGVAVLLLDDLLNARGLWLALALLCLPPAVAGQHWLRDAPFRTQPMSTWQPSPPFAVPPFLPWLAAAYGCVGLGYIVSGTFLVAIVQENIAGSAAGTNTWIVVGLTAAGSTLVWPALAARFGDVRALVAAHALQALGIALPALSPGLVAAYAGAVLFGGTLMGIVALTMGLGQRLAPQQSARVLGLLTAAYGTGQIIGPLLAGMIVARTNSFTLPLAGAALVVTAGAVLLLIGSRWGTSYQAVRMKGRTDAIR